MTEEASQPQETSQPPIDVKEAAQIALTYAAEVFDGIVHLALEEVVPTQQGGWDVTVGFSRAWDIMIGVAVVGAKPYLPVEARERP